MNRPERSSIGKTNKHGFLDFAKNCVQKLVSILADSFFRRSKLRDGFPSQELLIANRDGRIELKIVGLNASTTCEIYLGKCMVAEVFADATGVICWDTGAISTDSNDLFFRASSQCPVIWSWVPRCGAV